MLDEPHAAVAGPAALVVVTNDVVVSGIGVRAEVPLDEIAGFVGGEAEHDVEAVDVAGVEANGMSGFSGTITVLEEVVRELRRTGHFTGTLEAEDEEIEDKPVVLEHESRELKTPDKAIGVGVGHVCMGS